MKHLTKFVSLIVAGTIITSLLAGCNSSNKTSEKPEGTSAQATKQDMSNKKDWELNTAPFSVTWYRHGAYSGSTTSQDSYTYKLIREKTKMDKIEWIVPPSDPNQFLNTRIASNDLPDILTLDAKTTQAFDLVKNGRLLSYTKLSQQYAPMLMKVVLPKSLVDWWKDEKGDLYFIPNYFFAEENFKQGNYLETNCAPAVRKDIMEKLGIKADDFKDQDKSIEALKKVIGYKYKEQTVIPVALSEEGGYNETMQATLPGSFGVPKETKDGKYQDVRFAPEYKEVVSFANRLYREGLISKENFTQKKQVLGQNMQNGLYFMNLGNNGNFNNNIQQLQKADNNAEMIGVGPIASKEGRKTVYPATAGVGWTITAISANTKKAAEIVRAFSWMNTEEGKMEMKYGRLNETYTMDKDGRVHWTGERLKDNEMKPDEKNNKWGNGIIWWFDDGLLFQRTQELPTKPEEIAWKNLFIYHSPYVNKNEKVFGSLVPDGGTDESAISQLVEDSWKAAVPKIILAESEAKAMEAWQAWMKQAKDLGYDKLYKMLDQKFQERKKKLGMKFGWPEYK